MINKVNDFLSHRKLNGSETKNEKAQPISGHFINSTINLPLRIIAYLCPLTNLIQAFLKDLNFDNEHNIR